MVGCASFALLVTFSVGARGYGFLLTAFIVFLVSFFVCALAAGIAFAKLEAYQDPNDTRSHFKTLYKGLNLR